MIYLSDMKYEFFKMPYMELKDPPRHIDWIEKDTNGNILLIERFHGNGVIEKIYESN